MRGDVRDPYDDFDLTVSQLGDGRYIRYYDWPPSVKEETPEAEPETDDV